MPWGDTFVRSPLSLLKLRVPPMCHDRVLRSASFLKFVFFSIY